jgi:hypothetical protein
LPVDDLDREPPSVIGFYGVRQLKQFALGGLGRREWTIFLEFHYPRKSLRRASSTTWSADKIALTKSVCGSV